MQIFFDELPKVIEKSYSNIPFSSKLTPIQASLKYIGYEVQNNIKVIGKKRNPKFDVGTSIGPYSLRKTLQRK